MFFLVLVGAAVERQGGIFGGQINALEVYICVSVVHWRVPPRLVVPRNCVVEKLIQKKPVQIGRAIFNCPRSKKASPRLTLHCTFIGKLRTWQTHKSDFMGQEDTLC